MKLKTITLFLIPLLVLLLLASDALAHGGAWRGPTGTRKPADPGPGGLPGAGTPWPTTWGLNREGLLRLRALQLERKQEITPEESPHFLGRGKGRKPGDDRAEREAWDAIIEALLRAASDDNRDVATGAIIALGKSGDRRCIATLMTLAKEKGAHQSVNESAALALGMLGTKDNEIRTFLEKIAADTKLQTRVRAFACLGLGFHGDIAAIPALMKRMRTKETSRDVPACATLALGLINDDLVVPDLTRFLAGRPGQRTEDDILRAYNGAALALIRSRAALKDLVRALSDKHIEVRRQAVLSLAVIAKPEDTEVVKRLGHLLRHDRNVAVKAFCAFALGEIGNADSLPLLLHSYRKGDSFVVHYSILGLALLGRKSGNPEVRETVVRLLRSEFRRAGNNDLRGAIATAMGIIGDQESAKTLLKVVDSGGDPTFRSHAVLALGLMNHRPALPALRKLLTTRSSPALQREAALTLGLMGDSEATAILLKLVREGSSEYVRGSAAVALGRLATPQVAQELLKILDDKRATDMTRAFVTVALGLAVDRKPIPMLSRLGDHLNHFMVVAALGEALTLL